MTTSTSSFPSDPSIDARRAPWPGAVLGDGELLATISARGEVEQLWWPHIDRDPTLGELRLVAVGDAGARWLDDPSLTHTQRYVGDASVLATELTGAGLGEVRITDLVATDRPVVVRNVTGLGAGDRLGVFVQPQLGGIVRAGGAYLDPATGVLVCHRRDRVLAIGLDVPATGQVGERQRGQRTEAALADGELLGGGIVHGHVDGALLADDPVDVATVVIAVASTHEEAIAHVVAVRDAGWGTARAAREAADATLLAEVVPPLTDGPAATLDRRSQLVFSTIADRATGGVLAAPEADPDFERCGGYGFVWARDLAFILLAHLAAGRDDLAVPALRWLVRAQGHDGLWLQRNWTDGSLAPSWGTQLDETGAVLVAYEQAWQRLGDVELDATLWPSAARAADALLTTLDPETALPAPSMDLWEERVGVHSYTAATAVAGLRAAAAMADRHEPTRAAAWRDAAERVRGGIERHLWSEEHGRFLRSRDVARGDADGAPTPASYQRLDHPAAPVASVDPVDATVDACLLGLAYPFGVFPADDPRMAATIDAVEQRLTTTDGGLLRYVGDDYLGGNPWVLARLWLGLARRAPAAAVVADGVEYAVASRTPTDLLPEQVDASTGAPAWIVPLTWSHAMLTLAVRPDLPGLPTVAATATSAAGADGAAASSS